LCSRAEIDAEPGDRFLLQTPGGGGFGNAFEDTNEQEEHKKHSFIQKGSLHQYDSIQNSA
jgi:N-methylhydantoinase B/oxoprolinase/acetone carboxylase alpha subunit